MEEDDIKLMQVTKKGEVIQIKEKAYLTKHFKCFLLDWMNDSMVWKYGIAKMTGEAGPLQPCTYNEAQWRTEPKKFHLPSITVP